MLTQLLLLINTAQDNIATTAADVAAADVAATAATAATALTITILSILLLLLLLLLISYSSSSPSPTPPRRIRTKFIIYLHTYFNTQLASIDESLLVYRAFIKYCQLAISTFNY
jgi:hypothetical protein